MCSDYKEKETDMKSCKNCMLNNTCVDYCANKDTNRVCEWYTENTQETHFCDACQDYANCDLVDHDKEHGGKCCGDFREAESYAFGYSDAQIHGEDNKTQKKYMVDVYHDNNGHSTFRDVIKIKIIDLNAVSLLNIVTEDNCRYTYNLANVIGFKVTEEKENGSNL